MVSLVKSICKSCKYTADCTWQNVSGIWDCSEFLVSSRQNNQLASIVTSSTAAMNVGSLCGTCALKTECQWYQPKKVIFYCEHYE